ncbi:hypothetical protein JYT36_00755 [Bacteroidales bacterium AH-315-N07]|nr:hypothetical protein [Bacteroidales bacterium AH-315-N07]
MHWILFETISKMKYYFKINSLSGAMTTFKAEIKGFDAYWNKEIEVNEHWYIRFKKAGNILLNPQEQINEIPLIETYFKYDVDLSVQSESVFKSKLILNCELQDTCCFPVSEDDNIDTPF